MAAVLRLYRERYSGFNARHFQEVLAEECQIAVSYSWVKSLLDVTGLRSRQPRKRPYRRRRERKPMRGMMLHLDASTHRWFESAEEVNQDLLALLDDATGEIIGARFVPQESTASVIAILREAIERHGTFGALYTDRASHFVHTPNGASEPDRAVKTQVARVLDELGIELICAFTPQARGRSERLWRTLQGRLPNELKQRGVGTYEAANAYLEASFIRRFNRRFGVAPKLEDSAFVPVVGANLDRIFALRFERTVGLDHTVRFQRQVLQIPKTSGLPVLARRKVEVRLALDGQVSIYLGTRKLMTQTTSIDPAAPLSEAA